jgi:hypothetical protein
MPISDVSPGDDARQAARSLQAQYGEDAAVVAIMRASEYAAMGDLDACTFWEEVASLCEEGAGGSLN